MSAWLTVIIPTRKKIHGERQIRAMQRTSQDKAGVDYLLIFSGNTLVEKWKTGIDLAETPWVCLAADDFAPSPHWDVAMRHATTTFPDDIGLVHVNDGHFGINLCLFPCISRKVFRHITWPSEYQHWRIDNHLFDIFLELGRVAYLPNTRFDHAPAPMPVDLFAEDDATYRHLKPQRDVDIARLRSLMLVTVDQA